MPRLSNEKINEIRQSVDIVDVIGNYLPLERRGRNYLARCPFTMMIIHQCLFHLKSRSIDVLYVHTVEMCLLSYKIT